MSGGLVEQATQATDPLVKHHRRRIYKLSGEELDASLPRFGPLHGEDEPLILERKEVSWAHVLKRTPNRDAIATEVYLSAVRRVEKEARSAYADDNKVNILTGSQFRWMMIKDGCFFLQLVLSLLGGSEQLGYESDDFIFGQKQSTIKGWMKSIFFVGNQIPAAVLRVLMKQTFFEEVVAEGEWKRPSDLSKGALYDLVLLPELEDRNKWNLRSVFRRPRQEPPLDLLHALQFLVLGPPPPAPRSADADEDDDEGYSDSEESDARELAEVEQGIGLTRADDRRFPSATELMQSGIKFRVLKGSKGSNWICFEKGWFSLSATIWLPPFPFDENTEMIFRSLKCYEKNQPVCKDKLEVYSYLRFMSELIRTLEDAQHLGSKKIVRKGRRYHEKLPAILSRLALTAANDGGYNHRFRQLSLKVSDYTRPPWAKLAQFLSFVLFLTFIQTLYTVLSYHAPRN